MTRFRYTLATILKSFGVSRKLKRMTDAAYELHLMQEGEEFLGALCWPNVEEIEEISMEYWNVRKIERKRAEVEEKIEESNVVLQKAHTKRAAVAHKSKDIGHELLQEREQFFENLETLSQEREQLMNDAQQIKRRFEALKMKASVLRDEGSTQCEAYRSNREQLEQLKNQFSELKNKLSSLDRDIEKVQDNLAQLQEGIDHELKGNKDEAAVTFGQIGAANRDITKNKAQLGLLIEEHARLCREIGRYLNLNATLPECRRACKDHLGLLEQIRLLRRSIQWNRTLSETM